LSIQTHGIQTRGIQTHGIQTRGIQTRGIQTRGIQTHGIQTHGIQTHGIQTRGIQTRGIQTHGIQRHTILLMCNITLSCLLVITKLPNKGSLFYYLIYGRLLMSETVATVLYMTILKLTHASKCDITCEQYCTLTITDHGDRFSQIFSASVTQ